MKRRREEEKQRRKPGRREGRGSCKQRKKQQPSSRDSRRCRRWAGSRGSLAVSRPAWLCGLRQLQERGRECS